MTTQVVGDCQSGRGLGEAGDVGDGGGGRGSARGVSDEVKRRLLAVT